MLRIKKNRPKNIASTNVSQSDIRTITNALSQLLAITVAEEPEKVEQLLSLYGIRFNETPTERGLISGLLDKIADQDEAFNNDLELLINWTLPNLPQSEGYDNFGEGLFKFGGDTRIAGGSGGSAGFGGSAGIGGGSKLVDGATTIGSSTASGAAGGGIVGGILGAVGGIFSFASTSKQQEIEKEKAASKVFQDLINFKNGGNGSNGNSKGTYIIVGITILVLIGVILAVAKNQSKKVTI